MSRLPAQQRRSQLLDHAGVLFAKVGYARTTTAELAKAAGVTEPIIYRHFASKRDLFVDLIDRTAQRTLETWESHLAGAKEPAERLRRLLGDNPMTNSQEAAAYRVFLQAITEIDDDKIHKAVVSHITGLHAFLKKEIDRAQDDRKVIKTFSSDLVAWMLIHIGLGYGILEAMRIPGQGEDKKGKSVRDALERVLLGKD